MNELIEALKSTLPTLDDAKEDARAKVADYPAFQTVVDAYERQTAHIRALVAKHEEPSAIVAALNHMAASA